MAGLAAIARADLVAGEVLLCGPSRPTIWSLLSVDVFLDQMRNVRLGQAVTADLLIRRDLFETLGGFDPSLPSGGDYDLVRRALQRGATLAYASDATVCHPTIDTGRQFLRKVWHTNRWAAARRARERPLPRLEAALTLVPPVGALLARRRALRPLTRLARPRLEACGVRARRRDELRGLALLYGPVALVAGLAQLRGWLDGLVARRRR